MASSSSRAPHAVATNWYLRHLGRLEAPLVQRVIRYRAHLMIATSLLAPLALALVLVPLRDSFATPAAALVMLAVVVAVAVAGGRVDGLLASVSAALWFDFLLTRPHQRLAISHRGDLETTVALLVVGAIVSELAARNRHHLRSSSEASNYVTMVHDLAQRAANATPVPEVIARASIMLTELLTLRSCRYEPVAPEPPLARIVSDGQVIHVGLHWPVREIGIPGPEAEIAVQWCGQRLGRFVLTPTPGRPVSRERRIVAVALVDVVAATLASRR